MMTDEELEAKHRRAMGERPEGGRERGRVIVTDEHCQMAGAWLMTQSTEARLAMNSDAGLELAAAFAAALAAERERCAAWHDSEANAADKFAKENADFYSEEQAVNAARVEAARHRRYAAAIRALEGREK